MGIGRVAGLAWNRLLMRVNNSTGKGTSGMDKFSSKVHRVHMELGGKLLDSLRIETQFLERLQSVSVVDGAAHTQKDDVESNGGSLENVAKVIVLFLCGVQLVLRSGVLTVLDLDKVDVTPRFAEVFGSVLSGVGGSTGGWRCCWGAPSLPQLLPATSKNPPPYISLLFLCVFAAMGVTSTQSGRLEIDLSLSEKRGGKSHLGNSLYFQLFQESGDFAWSSVRCCLYPWRQCMILRSLFFWQP